MPSANRITLLRDADGDGVAELRTVFLKGLHSPFGMALVGDAFYVANTDALVRFPYDAGETEITAAPVKVVDLPAGPINHHWTKNLIASADGSKLYVAVGSNSNVAEIRPRRPRTGARHLGGRSRHRLRTGSSPPACGIPSAWRGSKTPARSGPR